MILNLDKFHESYYEVGGVTAVSRVNCRYPARRKIQREMGNQKCIHVIIIK